MSKKNLFFVALATFCLMSTLFIAMPVLAGTTPPPFDMLAAVKDIQTKVNTISGYVQAVSSALSTLQGLLTGLEQKLWSASNSIKNDTVAINQKLENVTKMETGGGSAFAYAPMEGYYSVYKSKPIKVTLTIATESMHPGELFRVQYEFGNYSNIGNAVKHVGYFDFTSDDTRTLEFVCQNFALYPKTVNNGFIFAYSYVIEYTD